MSTLAVGQRVIVVSHGFINCGEYKTSPHGMRGRITHVLEGGEMLVAANGSYGRLGRKGDYVMQTDDGRSLAVTGSEIEPIMEGAPS